MEITALEYIAHQVRRDIVRMVHQVQSGHPGGSLGCVEFFTALYFHLLEHTPASFDPNAENQDVFVLSNGHISPVYYSILARSGYFPTTELASFRRINSRLQGHPTTHENLPGVFVASGSLGQGMSVAIGAAQAKKLNQKPHLVYTLHGDGELQEGQIWEAIMYAGARGIDNLISTVDANGQQIDGSTNSVLPMGNLAEKFRAFGWDVLEIEQGNHMPSVLNGLVNAKSRSHKGKPVAVIMHTQMGAGVDFMQGTHEWHGIAPNNEQLALALAQIPETLGDY